jgi:hypothetical protein
MLLELAVGDAYGAGFGAERPRTGTGRSNFWCARQLRIKAFGISFLSSAARASVT